MADLGADVIDILVGEERVVDTGDDDEFETDNQGTSTLIDEWLEFRDSLFGNDDEDDEEADSDQEDTQQEEPAEDTTSQPDEDTTSQPDDE